MTNDILTDTIDNGKPLTACLQDNLCGVKLNASVLKKLRGMKKTALPATLKENFVFGSPSFSLLPTLNAIPPNWCPQTRQEWKGFCVCAENISLLCNITGRPFQDYIKETGGKWAEYVDMFKQHGNVRDVEDWLGAIDKVVCLPRYCQEQEQQTQEHAPALPYYKKLNDILVKTVVQQASIKDILAASKRWHEDLPDYRAKIASLNYDDEEVGDSWLPLSKTLKAPNGLYLKPLTSQAGLNVEASFMGHCVDGYASRCIEGKDHIISVSQDGDRERLVTVQLSETFNAAGQVENLAIVQCQGYKRRPPTEQEQDAISWYVNELFANEELTPDWHAIQSKRDVLSSKTEETRLLRDVGFDPFDCEKSKKAFYICRPYFATKKQRNMNYNEWFRKTGVDEIINSLPEPEQTARLHHPARPAPDRP